MISIHTNFIHNTCISYRIGHIFFILSAVMVNKGMYKRMDVYLLNMVSLLFFVAVSAYTEEPTKSGKQGLFFTGIPAILHNTTYKDPYIRCDRWHSSQRIPRSSMCTVWAECHSSLTSAIGPRPAGEPDRPEDPPPFWRVEAGKWGEGPLTNTEKIFNFYKLLHMLYVVQDNIRVLEGGQRGDSPYCSFHRSRGLSPLYL